MTVTSPADVNLAPEQYPDLNRVFYEADPAEYLTRRVRSLLISIADAPALRVALAEGVSYRSIKLVGDPDEPFDEEAAEAYGSTESTNLLHHPAECLLRLYFAHASMSPCPWLELARLRVPLHFKERVEKLRGSLGEQDTIDSLLTVFAGSTDPEKVGWKFTPEEWDRKTRGLVRLISHVCDCLLGDAGLYTATKHGLAAVAGENGLYMSSTEGGTGISQTGPGIVFLDQTPPGGPDQRRWTYNLRFVRTEANLALIEVIIHYVRSLWTVARYRYIGSTEVKVLHMEPHIINEFINLGRTGSMGFEGMSFTLAYYADTDPPAP